MYRLELSMARDHFLLESEKSRMNSFYPLFSFPDIEHPDYYIFDSQQKTDFDILQKLKDVALYKPSGGEFYHVQKVKKKIKLSKKISSFLNTRSMGSQATQSKSMALSLVRSNMSSMQITPQEFNAQILKNHTTVQTKNTGQIEVSKFELKVESCLYCAKLIELYQLRRKYLTFVADHDLTALKKLKNKQTRHWDDQAT